MTYQINDFARDLADQTVRERFGDLYGVESFGDYLDLLDQRQTQHLAGGAAARVLRTAGEQRQRIRLTVENAGTVILRVPMGDPKRPGATVWAEIELAAWLDLIENGADGAWFWNLSGKGNGYVRTCPPMQGATNAPTLVTVGRLVAGAGKGRIVRFRDRNPLNLRRDNIFIVGNPSTCEGPVKGPKHDARATVAKGAALRQSLAGAEFDLPDFITKGEGQ